MNRLCPTERLVSALGRGSGIALFLLPVCVCEVASALAATQEKSGILLVADSVEALPTAGTLQIPFRMRNDQDSVAAFEIMVVLSNSEVAVIDTLNPLDLGSSVLTGWSCSAHNSFGESIVRIIGVYNPSTIRPLPPDAALRELFKLNLLWLQNQPDTICNSTVDILIVQAETNFSDPVGNLIAKSVVNGSLAVHCPPCGDADDSGVVTVSDVVFLINYIFSGGPAPAYLSAADAGCSGTANVSDVVYLVNFIFIGGPIPCSGCLP